MVLSRARYAAALLGIASVFGVISYLAVSGTSRSTDEAILLAVHAQSSHALDTFFKIITYLGDPALALLIGLVLGITLLLKGRTQQALVMGLVIGGSTLLTSLLKTSFERARPDLWMRFANELSYSFPSGHAAASSILALVALYFFWHARFRRLLIAVCVLYVLMIGLSRLYLGVHYPTDIICGWLLSSFVFAVIIGYQKLRTGK
jgi:membrane-associated phospholipid phosphatase